MMHTSLIHFPESERTGMSLVIKYGCPVYSLSYFLVLQVARRKVTSFSTDLVPCELWVLGSHLTDSNGPGRIVLDIVRPNNSISILQTTEDASSTYTMWTCKAMIMEKAN